MSTSEKFCLKWNDFQENVGAAFRSMREDQYFADVILACEDGRQVEAHKVILAASSPFFGNLLKNIKHPHPLIYMRGMNFEELSAILDFLYHGEANIFQDSLDAFLKIAEELKLKGLTGKENKDEDKEEIIPQEKSPNVLKDEIETANDSMEVAREASRYILYAGTVAVPIGAPFKALADLDEQIKSLMGKTSLGQGQGHARICTVCGKEGNQRNIMDHIEANHIEGVCHSCTLCQKTFRSRPSLRMHKGSHNRM